MDFEDRAELLNADRAVDYVTDHYVGYRAVLVRMSRVNPDELPKLDVAGPIPVPRSSHAAVTILT